MSTGERKVSASLGRSMRGTTPRVADLASTPESPRTPHGRPSSIFGSPGGYRSEEDYIVIEVGARFVRGGLPGDSAPRCILSFGPEHQRRVGDYREWDPEFQIQRRKRRRSQDWGQEYELYRMDISDVDLGLVEDKFERAMREAFNKYFVLDTKPRRVMLALPSKMPQPLISTILDVLFGSFQAPSITLLSSPVLSTVAAGLRSALVVDIGWAETVVTGVCEYREIHERRTIRAGKLLSEEMAKVLNEALDDATGTNAEPTQVTFEEADEVISRVGWCKSKPKSNHRNINFGAPASPILEEFEDASESPEPNISIPFPRHTPPTDLEIPFSSLAKPAEKALFALDTPLNEFDDHELPIHHVIYRTLLTLPIDVRQVCMARIIITGGGSAIPGLKARILAELESLVSQKGWDPVRSYGSVSARRESHLQQQRQHLELRRQEGEDKVSESLDPNSPTPPPPAGLQNPEVDPIDTKLLYHSSKNIPPSTLIGGVIRGVDSLGPWAGASLVAQQRIRGIVEIDREKYLQYGLHGASKDLNVSVVPQRQSMGHGLGRAVGDRGSWTLGIWA